MCHKASRKFLIFAATRQLILHIHMLIEWLYMHGDAYEQYVSLAYFKTKVKVQEIIFP